MKAYLLLANGMVFEGRAFGAAGTSVGEVVFNTGMVGYEETLTDPSYYGQIITQTYPLVGNYGVNGEDAESARIWAFGYIVRELCGTPSNFRCQKTLDEFEGAGDHRHRGRGHPPPDAHHPRERRDERRAHHRI